MQANEAKDAVLHITDMHFWKLIRNPLKLLNKRFIGNANVFFKRRHHFAVHRAHEFAEHAMGAGIAAIIFGGDFTSTATEAEYEIAVEWVQGMQDEGLKIYLMPGNHDVYTFETVKAQRFEEHFKQWAPPGGYPARYTLEGGTGLILVPTVVPNYFSSRGLVTDQEIADTVKMVQEAPPGPVLVAGHYPLLHNTYAYETKRSRRLRNAGKLREALGGAGREILYMAGHVHQFSYLRDRVYPNLRHMTTSAFLMKRHQDPEEGAFSEVHVLEDGFEVFEHALRGSWERSPRDMWSLPEEEEEPE